MTNPTTEPNELDEILSRISTRNHPARPNIAQVDPWSINEAKQAIEAYVEQKNEDLIQRILNHQVEADFGGVILKAVSTGWIKAELQHPKAKGEA